MRVAIIVNPTAGRGLAATRGEQLVATVRDRRVDVRIFQTRQAGDARRFACEVGVRFDTVVAVGGDGTVHEVAAGLVASGGDAVLTVLPSGSGNDFAKMLRVSSDPAAAVEALLYGTEKRIDLGSVTVTDDQGVVMDDVFINAMGVGFDSAVAERASRSRKLRGTIGYLIKALAELGSWKPVSMSVYTREWQYEGSTLLVTLGNGTCSGGGFYLTPDASIVDGELDLCHIAGLGLGGMLLLLPRVLWGGHLGHEAVTYLRTDAATIKTAVPLPVHLDGEIVSNKALEIGVKVQAGAIVVRAPF